MARSGSHHVAEPASWAQRRGIGSGLLLSTRPQWSKNLLVFAGLLLAKRLFDPPSVIAAIGALTIFSALSAVVYLINDVADRESDWRHPLRRTRPIAAGVVPVPVALSTAGALSVGVVIGAAGMGRPFAIVALAYCVISSVLTVGLRVYVPS
jgi:decaprenyl-phosphate phosphoribosyltransferase